MKLSRKHAQILPACILYVLVSLTVPLSEGTELTPVFAWVIFTLQGLMVVGVYYGLSRLDLTSEFWRWSPPWFKRCFPWVEKVQVVAGPYIVFLLRVWMLSVYELFCVRFLFHLEPDLRSSAHKDLIGDLLAALIVLLAGAHMFVQFRPTKQVGKGSRVD